MATAAMAANEVLARVRGRGYPLSGTRGTWLARVDAAMRATLHLPVTRRIKVVRTTEWGDPRRTRQLAACGCTGRRPPATLPSRSAIARPRLAPRLPLGTLALFPPLLSRYPLTRQSNILGKWGL